MSAPPKITTHPQSPGTVFGNTPDCLTDIFADHINLAVWERTIPARTCQFVSAYARAAGARDRFISIEPGEGAQDLLPEWALQLDGAQDWLADIRNLTDMYHCLFEPARIGIRLHLLNGTTMCPRFHTDRVSVRLLCTYQGPGTEWLPEWAARRPKQSGPLPDQVVQPHHICQIPSRAVALLKGEAWEGNEGRGLIHRSPETGQEPRMVVGFDWLS